MCQQSMTYMTILATDLTLSFVILPRRWRYIPRTSIIMFVWKISSFY